ncbi:hypothetical protein TRAPUB_8682, partial [Trametes pubescens]
GAVAGIFQDPSTFKLHLTLEPVMYMWPLKVVLAEFVGDECQYLAPTWLSRLWRAESKSAQRVRSYKWVITYVYTGNTLLTHTSRHGPQASVSAELVLKVVPYDTL